MNMNREKNRVEELRVERRYTYVKLAKLSGLSRSTVQRIAKFETTPNQSQMKKLAKAFGMKVWEVFDLDVQWNDFTKEEKGYEKKRNVNQADLVFLKNGNLRRAGRFKDIY